MSSTQSPFIKHREKVLGYYSTAAWLRQVVLAMHSGYAHPTGLSKLTNLDNEHYAAFIEMVTHYRKHGENDPAFMSLAGEVLQRKEAEALAERQEEEFKQWSREARQHLRARGLPPDEVEDRYQWFFHAFTEGDTPEAAVEKFAARERVQPLD